MSIARKHFNTAGPVNANDHYLIDPLHRIDLEEIEILIENQKYFVLHAPRQTGKTSYMLSLMEYLNQQGNYTCLYVNVEAAQAARQNIHEGIKAILSALGQSASYYLKDSFIEENWVPILNKNGALIGLNQMLSQWSQQSEKPIVLFIDEIDSLVGDTLISVLRQLRSGYTMRPGAFPQSVILCGVRDVRDYRIYSDEQKDVVTGGSAFNIKTKSLRLGNFNAFEIEALYQQHTTETGQSFAKDIFQLVWDLTEGQPWLVNALAYEACFDMKEGRDRNKEITRSIIEQAKENLILRRDTHLDQLSDKLKEDRVRRVIEPLLVGSEKSETIPQDDIDYVVDLGLVKKDRQIRIANRIYQEVIPRTITYSTQLTIHQESLWYLKEDGSLDMGKLLLAYQDFFRNQFESWVGGFDYKEAGPQLLLQAFLQRIVNGGGRVEREYGLGRQRTDIMVFWPYRGSIQRAVIELKIQYGKLETTIKQGLEQTYQYMDKCGASVGYLLIINQAAKKSWKEKIFTKERTFNGSTITIYGM